VGVRSQTTKGKGIKLNRFGGRKEGNEWRGQDSFREGDLPGESPFFVKVFAARDEAKMGKRTIVKTLIRLEGRLPSLRLERPKETNEDDEEGRSDVLTAVEADRRSETKGRRIRGAMRGKRKKKGRKGFVRKKRAVGVGRTRGEETSFELDLKRSASLRPLPSIPLWTPRKS